MILRCKRREVGRLEQRKFTRHRSFNPRTLKIGKTRALRNGNDAVSFRPIRVAHVMWRLSKGGGIPVVVRAIADGIDPARTELHVITLRPLFDEDQLASLPPTVHVHGLGHIGAVRPFQRIRVLRRVSKLLRRVRPDVVQVHSGTAWMAALARLSLPRTPFLIEVHDAPGSGRHGRFTDKFEGFLARRLGVRPICHSTSVQLDVAAAWKVPPPRSIRFPLGIDVRLFDGRPIDGREWRRVNGVPLDRPMVLYVARLVATKNIRLFLDVAERVRQNATGTAPAFVVVADGPLRSVLGEDIERRKLGKDVFLLPSRHGDELAAAYAAADVFCSTSDYEGFGLAVVEAMASGLPVVATRVGGHSDLVVDGETGFLVASGDADAFATSIQRLTDDGLEATRMGDAGKLRARQLFDVRAMVRAFEDCYAANSVRNG